jgi:elongation factor Ts
MARPGFEEFARELTELRARIGENIQVDRAVRFGAGEGRVVGSYLHFGGKIGVLVELEEAADDAAADLARDVAMHVAASRPEGISPEDIPDEVRERERAVLLEQTRAEGKPEQILEKIVEGRMRKFYEQNALLMQAFVRDPDVTIAGLLEERGGGASIRRFARFEIGE